MGVVPSGDFIFEWLAESRRSFALIVGGTNEVDYTYFDHGQSGSGSYVVGSEIPKCILREIQRLGE